MINMIAIGFILLLGIACVWRAWDECQEDKKKEKMP